MARTLRYLLRDSELTVLLGPSRGMRWIVGSGNLSAWLGLYENQKLGLFAQAVEPCSIVLDVGAHVGYYTLAASRITGQEGTVIALEPLPRNPHYLREHVKRNALSNVRIIEAAVGNQDGITRFAEGPNSYMGRVSESSGISVRAVKLDTLYDEGTIPAPALIKMDVEGGEKRALEGARELISEFRPLIFLATHGIRIRDDCLELLKQHGYTVTPICETGDEPDEFICRPNSRVKG